MESRIYINWVIIFYLEGVKPTGFLHRATGWFWYDLGLNYMDKSTGGILSRGEADPTLFSNADSFFDQDNPSK